MGLSWNIGSESWDFRRGSALYRGIVTEYRQCIVGLWQIIGSESWDCCRVSAVNRGIVAEYRQCIVGLSQRIGSVSWDCPEYPVNSGLWIMPLSPPKSTW